MANRYSIGAVALFAIGMVLLAASVLRGEGGAGIALIVPFFYGSGPLASLGVLCFFAGMVLLFFGLARGEAGAGEPVGRDEAAEGGEQPADEQEGPAPAGKRTRGGAVILIGPIPIIYGSDPGMAKNLFWLALALMVLFMLVLVSLAMA